MARSRIDMAVLVGSLGYFVDTYDLLLFSVVRVPSLTSLGLPPEQVLVAGVALLNWQMAGMLCGGLLWGVLGDRAGRRTVLFGSILLYSLANLLNACVTGVPAYAALRLLAGLGLAGELGAAITLVSERLSPANRGYGTTLVACVGIMGAILAAIVGELLPWRSAYVVGGVLGLALLVLRMRTPESRLFQRLSTLCPRGDLRLLGRRWPAYVACVLVGVPIWYATGVLVTFSPELAREAGALGAVLGSRAVLVNFVGGTLGNLACGLLSQRLRSRRKAVLIFLLWLDLLAAGYLCLRHMDPAGIYLWLGVMGTGCGYWAVLLTIAAEQFGTNLRATVTTTVPNLVRGSTVLMAGSFQALRGSLGGLGSAGAVGAVCSLLALLALAYLPETYGRELDFLEDSQ